MLLNKVSLAARDRCGLNLDDPLVVGLSGGADSLCLLDGLRRLGYRVIAAHFDHQLRPESSLEAGQVEEICRGLGVRFLGGRGAVGRGGRSLEEAARVARYQFLFTCARKENAQAVVVGHTADDQVETVLLHLLQGSGPAGLKGMSHRSANPAWDAALPLARPLLGVRHSETVAYCQERGLQPLQDPSNGDVRFARNRVRGELLPLLETYNPRFRQAVLRLASLVGAEDDLLEEMARQAWLECFLTAGNGFVALRRAEFGLLPLALQRRVLRRAASLLQADLRELDQETTDRGLVFLGHPAHSFPVDLAAGVCLRVEGEIFYLARWDAGLPSGSWPQMRAGTGGLAQGAAPDNGLRTLSVPGFVELSEGWRLEARRVEDIATAWQCAPGNPDPYLAWLDADKVSLPLVVRTRRPGDRFQPLGLDGHSQKLSDFFVNARLPARARESWPLICSGEQVVWVAGFRLAHAVRIDEQSREAIVLRCYLG
jgi:tRNA(Ile)-lysidine synthase